MARKHRRGSGDRVARLEPAHVTRSSRPITPNMLKTLTNSLKKNVAVFSESRRIVAAI
jgi:hypothetical protein